MYFFHLNIPSAFYFVSLHHKCYHTDGYEYSCNRISIRLSTAWGLPNFKYPVKVTLKVPSIATDFFDCIHEWLTGTSDYCERNVFSWDKNTFFKAYKKKEKKHRSQIFGRNVLGSVGASASFKVMAFLPPPAPNQTSVSRGLTA